MDEALTYDESIALLVAYKQAFELTTKHLMNAFVRAKENDTLVVLDGEESIAVRQTYTNLMHQVSLISQQRVQDGGVAFD